MRERVKLTANILFSGIGCQERGFRDSGLFDIKVLNTSDINKESVLSYATIHCGMTNEMVDTYTAYPSREEMAQYLTDINLGYEPEKDKYFDWFKLIKRKKNDLEKYWLACKLTQNLGDITKIEDLPYADFWTVSFPCQSISVAGKMKGLKPDSGTRSSLLWDNIRLLSKAKENNKLPQYIMFENVKNLVSKKFIADFNDLMDVLDELGFNSYWSVINGKDCGIPQSRERVFVISIRKDIDNGKYEFPVPFDAGIRLKDVLENQVDEKYYLPDEKVQEFLKTIDLSQFCKEDNELHQLGYINGYNGDANRIYSDNVARTLKSEAGGGGAKTGWYTAKNDILKVGQLSSSQDGIVVSPEGVSKTHTAGHNNMPKIICGIDKSVNEPQVLENANCITAREDRGVSNRKAEGTAILETPDISYCLDANYWKGTTPEQYINKKRRQLIFEDISKFIRIRKLTPRECWTLMGLTFEDCDKAAEIGVADTHLYKQAGNGIITNCCALLAEHLYKAQYDDTYVCTDERYQGNFTKPQVE
ncbi:DNA (cytosine-5-)-methyltransferase [Thomasclavelia cocleata]|uniref:DNA (cytosine-5-)-methyltransferase n=1 Tax=Thomasclavelia cocleata TaxID=69824 RepID=UPI00255A75A5|nr:DNA (cytosine-5-)-methyltransferase [Thomasclavelia cocleata]